MRTSLPLMIMIILVQACSTYPASITSLKQPPSIKITTHQVEQGDTLYSIAWRYDLTVDVLAEINKLNQPYIIKQGQILHLDPQSEPQNQPYSTVQKISQGAQTVGRKIITMVKKPSQKETDTKPSSSPAVAGGALAWQSPVQGKVVEDFNPKELRKGITLESKGGASVRPVASGEVVYAGDGLRDYGKLVIIKHTSDLLSAYGHNQTILVSEGQTVKNGDFISTLGSSGRLYFEIRKDGKPVNPERYLN